MFSLIFRSIYNFLLTMADNNNEKRSKKTKTPVKVTTPKNQNQNSKDAESILKQRINTLAVDVGNLKKQNSKLTELVEKIMSCKGADRVKGIPMISKPVVEAIKQNTLCNQNGNTVVRVPTHDASACAVTGDSQTTKQSCDTDVENNFMCYTMKSPANPQASTIGFDVIINSGTSTGTKLIVPLANLKPALPLQAQAHTSDGSYAVVPRSFSTIQGVAAYQSYLAYPVKLDTPAAAHWHARLIGASSGTDKIVIVDSAGVEIILSGDAPDVAIASGFTSFAVWLDAGSNSDSFKQSFIQFEAEALGGAPMTFEGSKYCQCLGISKLVHNNYFLGDDTTSLRVAEIAHMFTYYGSSLDNAGSFNAATVNTPLVLQSSTPSYSYATAMSTCDKAVQSAPLRLGLYQPSYPFYPPFTAGDEILDPFNADHSQIGVLWTFANVLRLAAGDGPQPLALKLHAVIEYKSKQPIGAVNTTYGLSSEFEMARKILLNNYQISHNPDHLTSALNRVKDTVVNASKSVFHWFQDSGNNLINNMADPTKREKFANLAKTAASLGEVGIGMIVDAL